MNKTLSKLAICGIFVLPLAGGLVSMGTAYADEHEMRHWNYDDRHHHAHYYPAFGYRIGVLPPGYLALGFGGRRLFFLAGVWYEPTPAGYVVVRPPVGIITPSLPPDYSTVWVGGVPYYYANDTYYTSGPGGYVVANPPAAGTYTEAPPALPPAASVPQMPPPAPPAPAPAAQPSLGMWYFCASSNAYYPYVATCKEGWKPVPAVAPGGH